MLSMLQDKNPVRQVGTVSTGNGGMKKLQTHSSVSMLRATQARQTSRLGIKWPGQSFVMKVKDKLGHFCLEVE